MRTSRAFAAPMLKIRAFTSVSMAQPSPLSTATAKPPACYTAFNNSRSLAPFPKVPHFANPIARRNRASEHLRFEVRVLWIWKSTELLGSGAASVTVAAVYDRRFYGLLRGKTGGHRPPLQWESQRAVAHWPEYPR